MRIFSVIILIVVLTFASTAYGFFTPILFQSGGIWRGADKPIWSRWSKPKPPKGPPNGFWFKPGTDIEQLKQDYSECGGKDERPCMREKGYFWLTPDTGFWYKIGTAQQQIVQDYSECRGIGERLCMEEKGYTWASYRYQIWFNSVH